jgi:glycogen synthase
MQRCATREQGFPVSLTLVGGVFPGYEWFEEKLRRMAAGSPAISFAGCHDSVWALAEADIALVPSRWEPFGMSRSKRCSPVARLLQAMSKG